MRSDWEVAPEVRWWSEWRRGMLLLLTDAAVLLIQLLLAPPLMAFVIQEWESAMREGGRRENSETEKSERDRDQREGWVRFKSLLSDLWHWLVS